MQRLFRNDSRTSRHGLPRLPGVRADIYTPLEGPSGIGSSEFPTRIGHTIRETRSWWGVLGERLRSPSLPPCPPWQHSWAGTEPERSGGGVRLMLNRVN